MASSGPVSDLSINVNGEEQLRVVAAGYKAINDNAARLNDTLDETATKTEQVERRSQSVTAAYERLARAYDPVLRSAQQLKREEDLLERAWRQGVVTGSDYGRMMNTIHQRHIDVANSANKAKKEINDLADAEERRPGVLGHGGGRALAQQGSQFFQQGLAGGFSPAVMTQAALMQGMDILPMMNFGAMGGLGMAGMATLGTGAAVAGGLGLAYALGKNVEVFEEHSIKLREVVVGVVADVVIAAKDGAVAVYEHIRDSVANIISGVMEMTGSTTESVKDRVNTIIGIAKTGFDVLNVDVKDMLTLIGSGAIDAANTAVAAVERIINGGIAAIERLLGGAAQGVNSLRDMIASGLEGIPGTGGIVDTLKNTRAQGMTFGRVELGRMDNPLAGRANEVRRDRDQMIRDNMNRDYIGEIGDYLQGAGERGRERMKNWGDKGTTDRAKEMTKTLEAETDAIRKRTAAMDMEKNVREDALRKIDRELDLRKTMADLEKASPNSRAAVETATRAKWAAEDASIAAERNAAQRDLNDANKLAVEGLNRQTQAYGLEKGARETALRGIERELALRQELAATHPSGHAAVRGRHAATGAAQDALLTAQADAGVADSVAQMGRQTAYGRRQLGVRQATVGDPVGRREQLRSLEREFEVTQALANLGPNVSDKMRQALTREIQERQKLTDEITKQQEAEQKRLYDRSRSVRGSFADYFAEAENSAMSVGQQMVSVFDTTTRTIGGMFVDMASGAEVSFQSIIKSMLRMQAEMVMNQGISMLMGAIGRGLGLTVAAPTGGAMVSSAMGNAFGNGRVVKSYSQGGVLDKHLTVPLAEMGEGGRSEGLFPLRRTSDGRLGVEAVGSNDSRSGGGGVVINMGGVTINPPEGGMSDYEAQQTAEKMTRAFEDKVDLMIEKKVGNQRRAGGAMTRRTRW